MSYTCLPPLHVTGQNDSQVPLFIYAPRRTHVLRHGGLFSKRGSGVKIQCYQLFSSYKIKSPENGTKRQFYGSNEVDFDNWVAELCKLLTKT